MPVKVLYIISDIEKALAFEWIVDTIDRKSIDLQFILIGKKDTPLVTFMRERNVTHYLIGFDGKKDLLKAWVRVFTILRKQKPDVVHAHLYYATLMGIPTAWVLRIPKRIFTRHHGSLHHRYFPRAVYWDKLLNRLATHIVVMCENLKTILVEWEKTSPDKIQMIPHGFDFSYFKEVNHQRIAAMQKKYLPTPSARPILGVVARYINWKGIQYIVPAFKKVRVLFPQAHLILANAQGSYSKEIREILKQFPKDSYTEISFEEDIAALYGLFDVFVHAPIDEYSEAFGQTYVEALATGVPAVFTLSGIACDFIEHKKNALVVRYGDSNQIAEAVVQLLNEPALRKRISEAGKNDVEDRFALHKMIGKLETLYTK